jgi:two-component system, NtrC family, sensor kinase
MMKGDSSFSHTHLSSVRHWGRPLMDRSIPQKALGLKTKITFLVILFVAGVLFLSGYLDYHFSRKAQFDLYLDRNLYIAKQIDISIPDQGIMNNLPYIHDEIEEWILSRRFLTEIDVFLFTAKEVEVIVSNSRDTLRTPFHLTANQVKTLKKDDHLSSLFDAGEGKRLEIIVPLHSGPKIVGGIRLISSLDEAQSYLSKKRDRAVILTLSSIFAILLTLTLLLRKLVENPIRKLLEAMAKAEKGDLEAEAHIQSSDELGKLGRNFNQMLKTIRETHEQNVHLLSQVNQFNEELTQKIEAATFELAKRNEELRLLNEALFESQRQVGQSEKLAALGQVTATMAHQMGTPLNSISGYIQLMLREGNLPPRERERLKIIESQLDRLAESVKNLLSFTRQPKPQLKPLSANEVLEDLIRLSEPWFNARKVKLSTFLSPDLPPILGDPTHLQTLFLNLITNALDAMPQGGTLTLRTRQIPGTDGSKKGGWIEAAIADTGIGMTEETKKKIFEPFFTTKKLGEGTGLGLAICHQIIKEHAGRIDIASEVGKGSTFLVSIPIPQENELDESIPRSSAGRG